MGRYSLILSLIVVAGLEKLVFAETFTALAPSSEYSEPSGVKAWISVRPEVTEKLRRNTVLPAEVSVVPKLDAWPIPLGDDLAQRLNTLLHVSSLDGLSWTRTSPFRDVSETEVDRLFDLFANAQSGTNAPRITDAELLKLGIPADLLDSFRRLTQAWVNSVLSAQPSWIDEKTAAELEKTRMTHRHILNHRFTKSLDWILAELLSNAHDSYIDWPFDKGSIGFNVAITDGFFILQVFDDGDGVDLEWEEGKPVHSPFSGGWKWPHFRLTPKEGAPWAEEIDPDWVEREWRPRAPDIQMNPVLAQKIHDYLKNDRIKLGGAGIALSWISFLLRFHGGDFSFLPPGHGGHKTTVRIILPLSAVEGRFAAGTIRNGRFSPNPDFVERSTNETVVSC